MANMVNNIGTITELLPITIGEDKEFTIENLGSIGIISGELSIGFLLFDSNGTIAVCTKLIADEDGNPTYTFTTSSISADIIIKTALAQSY